MWMKRHSTEISGASELFIKSSSRLFWWRGSKNRLFQRSTSEISAKRKKSTGTFDWDLIFFKNRGNGCFKRNTDSGFWRFCSNSAWSAKALAKKAQGVSCVPSSARRRSFFCSHKNVANYLKNGCLRSFFSRGSCEVRLTLYACCVAI